MQIILVTNKSPISHTKPSVSGYIIRRRVVNEPAATREAANLTYIRIPSTGFYAQADMSAGHRIHITEAIMSGKCTEYHVLGDQSEFIIQIE